MDRTNETATGYSYGGQQYQKQTRTDSQGNTYTVDIPVSNSIPVSTVTAQTSPMVVPQPQAPTNYNQITTGVTSPYLEAAQMQQQWASNQLSSDANSIQSLMSSLSGKSAYEAQQAQDLGLNQANQDYITKSAELAALNKQAAAAQQENIAQGRQLGSVASFVAGQGSEIERNRAIRALTIGAELDAIQGNIQVAQMKVKQAVDAKYASQEIDLANRLKMFDINKGLYDTLSTQEQKQWDRAKYATEQAQKKLDEQKKNFEDIQNMIIEATPNAPKNIIANAKKIAEQGGSKLAVAQALGVYGGDYLKNELLKEQIKSQKAEQSKIYQDIAKSKSEMSTDGIPTKPLTETQAKDLTYAQRTSQSLPTLSNLESKIVKMNPLEFATQWKLVQNPLTSGQVSDDVRQYYQAAQNFTSATLRRESGASIASSEYNNAFSNYLAYPGDDAKTLAQKKQARETASNSFKQAVPGYEQRVSTPEDTYLDKVALPSVSKVNEQVNNPIANYRMKLQSLPGVKQ